ncbi:MAG: hypothetical protein ACOC56_03185 [Atribacterota bacterium]
MIFQKGENWNDLPTYLKRGRCIIPKKTKVHVTKEQTKGKFEGEVERNIWTVDNEIPIFTKDRNYIEKFLNVDKNDKEQ